MFGHRKPRKNQRKGKITKREFKFLSRILLGFKLVAAVAAVTAVSAFFILVHDILTQCDYFKISRLTIEGAQRLTKRKLHSRPRSARA